MDPEYTSLHSTAGLVDLGWRDRLRVRGADRASFLQAMTTNDVAALAPGAGCRAVFVNVKGRILADARVLADGDAYWVDLPPGRGRPVSEHLRKYIISEQVEVDDMADAWGAIAIIGPAAESVVAAAIGRVPDPLPLNGHAPAVAGGTSVRLVRVRHGVDGFELWAPLEQLAALWDLLRDRGRAAGAVPVGLDALEVARIESGEGGYGADFDESNFPQEAGLDDAISYTKGCYLGQEVIARIHFQGHVNRRLIGLTLEGETLPATRSEVRAGGKPAGHVTSAARSPALGRPVALAMLARAAAAPGTQVEVVSGAGTVLSGRVVSLPFGR